MNAHNEQTSIEANAQYGIVWHDDRYEEWGFISDTDKPLTHAEACTMLSRFSPHQLKRISRVIVELPFTGFNWQRP